VVLDWPDDAEPASNLGQSNTEVKQLNSPRAMFTFPLRNDAAHAGRPPSVVPGPVDTA
jgi:hypothetical protein